MTSGRQLAVVIMAAGKGKRMRDDLPKVLHEFGGKPMILWVVSLAEALRAKPVILVVGYQAERVKAALAGHDLQYVLQAEPRGTAHAVSQAAPLLEGFRGDVAVLSGDVPAISLETLTGLVSKHRATGAAATLLAAETPEPAGYGRVITSAGGHLLKVVEDRDATPQERAVKLVNTGVYVFKAEALLSSLALVNNDNKQNEYYLPDTLYILKEQSRTVAVEKTADYRRVFGVNTKDELRKLHAEVFA